MENILFIINLVSWLLIVMHCLSDWKILKLEGLNEKIISIIHWKIRFAVGVVALELFLSIANANVRFFLICFIVILVLDIIQLKKLNKN